MNDDLRLALSLADEADAITMHYFQSTTLAVRTKSDRTPVSEADEAVERAIRERLERERPDDGILGEEFGARGTAGRRWIIDPIDATKNYVRGIPVFATLIALDGQAGVVSAPALGRRWWASRGDGAFCNGRAIHVSAIDTIGAAQLCYDDVPGFERAGLGERFLDLTRRCARSRGFGDFWSHMLVAEGAAEIAIEPEVAHWDMAAVLVIVEEAGGRFTNLRGEARADGGSGLSTNGLLHDAALGAIAPYQA
ncbi:MAG TPA: inositol monophosphatase family protein [Thermoanaerobaculia bacterium]|jgi:histidinol-phosphatase|nr:inositol monophosphatase family protein [Thermoanaerobaculia bacterium]